MRRAPRAAGDARACAGRDAHIPADGGAKRGPAVTTSEHQTGDPAAKAPTGQAVWLRDLLLIALTFASGAVDAISYFGLRKTFSAFMTGNIVFLGFGIANIKGPALLPVICALSAFAVGSYLGLRISMLRSQESGWWPRKISVLLTVTAMSEAAFVGMWVATNGQPSAAITDVLIVLYSLGMGMQTAAVRSLGVQGVFTTAGTFTLVALTSTFAGSRSNSRDAAPGRRSRRVGHGSRGRRSTLPARAHLRARPATRCHFRRDPAWGGSSITTAYRLVSNRSWTPLRTWRSVEGEGAQP